MRVLFISLSHLLWTFGCLSASPESVFAMHSSPLKSIPILKVKAHRIINRSAILTQFLAMLLAGAFVLVAWRVYSAPLEALHMVLSFGATMGKRISV